MAGTNGNVEESGLWYFTAPDEAAPPKRKRRTLLSRNERTRAAIRTAVKAAQSESAILIIGETGSGKELFARAIHAGSQRKEGPFVAVNCAGIPDALLESELFGHERGAFTGADRQHKGRFELAHGGTLFLDEVGELSLTAQAKLLRVIETHSFERVGGEIKVRVDVRIIAATHRELRTRIPAGQFREDLFYRLNEISIAIPPLRERTEDIPILVRRFIDEVNEATGKKIRGVSAAALHTLMTYGWPGNVRELRGVIRRACTLCERDVLWVEDLGLPGASGAAPAQEESEDLSLEAMERRHIQKVLTLTGGNKRRASEVLGISRPTLDEKIRRYGISVTQVKSNPAVARES